MLIKEALADIAEELKKDAVKVRTSMAIFIGGSYHLEDKKYLEKLREKLKEEGFPGAFLMEEIDGGENDLNLKFHKIWRHMSQLNPLFLLFAGRTAAQSQGFLVEIVEIANDPQKYECAYLFELPNTNLPHHKKRLDCREVQNGDEFIDLGIQTAKREANRLQYVVAAVKGEKNENL